VTVYVDTNGDMGGEKPVVAEAGLDYQGYEGTFDMVGDKVAYARLVPDTPAQVQIAVSRKLLEDPKDPLAALYSLDNTCRLPYGFEQSGSYPGMCKLGVPVESCTLYCTGFLQGGYCYRGEWVCR